MQYENETDRAPMWLRRVHCYTKRDKNDITECAHSDWGVGTCPHPERVHLSCPEYTYSYDGKDSIRYVFTCRQFSVNKP